MFNIQVSAEQTAFLNLRDGMRFPTQPSLCSWHREGATAALPTITHTNIFASPLQQRQTLFFCWPALPWTGVCRSKPEKGTPNIFSFRPPHAPRLCHQPGDTGTAQEPLSGSSQVTEWTSHVSPFAQHKNRTEILPLQLQGLIFPPICHKLKHQFKQLVLLQLPKRARGAEWGVTMHTHPGSCCSGLEPHAMVWSWPCRNTGKSRGFGGFIRTRKSLLKDWWLSLLSSTASNKLHIVAAPKA